MHVYLPTQIYGYGYACLSHPIDQIKGMGMQVYLPTQIYADKNELLFSRTIPCFIWYVTCMNM
jgi:hypothetical protein